MSTNSSFDPQWDPALLARCDLIAAGEVVYPPAAQCRPDFDEQTLRGVIRSSNEEPIPRPLAIHVQLPRMPDACTGTGDRDTAIGDGGSVGRYLEFLYREIELIAPSFDRDRTVRRLRLIGAGASALDGASLRELCESLARHFSFSTDRGREYSIEADPGRASPADIQTVAELGFNQLALAVSDADPAERADHSDALAASASLVEVARAAGFTVTVELVCALPLPPAEAFTRWLKPWLALRPDRIRLHLRAAAPLPWRAPSGPAVPTHPTPDMASLGVALRQLLDSGYVYLGLGQFALTADPFTLALQAGTLKCPDGEYTLTADCDVIGLGVGAASCIGESCHRNAGELPGYCAALDNGRLPVACGLSLDEDDLIRRALIATVHSCGIIDKARFGARHRLLFDEYFVRERQQLRPLVAAGLVQDDSRALRVTSRGRLLLRIISGCFDAYHASEPQAVRHARGF